jgi:hypothetical protein
MKLCDVPTDFTLDLGYRKVAIKAGKRHYPDEVADAYPMTQYVVGDAPAPESEPEPAPEPESKKGK